MSDADTIISVRAKYIHELLDKISDLRTKIDILGRYMETEDGIFTFSDGDYVYTSKK